MQAAILVGLAMAVLWFLEKLGGTPMVIRPIVVSAQDSVRRLQSSPDRAPILLWHWRFQSLFWPSH